MAGRSHPEIAAGFWIPPELRWVILSGFYKQERIKKKMMGNKKKKKKLKVFGQRLSMILPQTPER